MSYQNDRHRSKRNNILKFTFPSSEQQAQMAPVADISWAVGVLNDIWSFAQSNGHMEIANELEVARLRIVFLLQNGAGQSFFETTEDHTN